MNKSTHFSGQPTFAQLVKMIPKDIVANCVAQTNSDYYYKRFNTWHHLMTMLFTCYGHCHSLREVVSGMRALEGRLQSSSVSYFPARSTFSEANANRNCKVFELIYFALKKHWQHVFPDSRKIFIVDSTTIKLFQEIFRGAGMSKKNGSRKGGLKVHMAIQDKELVPSILNITQAAYNDVTFFKTVDLPMGSTVIIDRGYRDHNLFNKWSSQQIRWNTRAHPNSVYRIKQALEVNSDSRQSGVQEDYHITLGHPVKAVQKVDCRLVKFQSPSTGKYFEFLTNDLTSAPELIAQLYKSRWKIELVFKRLKQNMPLRDFLGDNKNAIQIQVWSALIADLLLQVLISQIKKKWAFSNVVSILRLHLFNYLDLFSFLENPERATIASDPLSATQFKLQFSG